MAISKIILNGVTQMDLTQDTTDASKTLASYTGHGADGQAFTGTYVPASPTLQTKTATYTPTTSQQTATITADVGYDGLDEVDITVNAMPTGTAGTPTATKGAVSNHSISVTPSVTNTTGYITGSTKTGTAVTVSASELVSGTYNVSASGTADVTNYATATVPAASFYVDAEDKGFSTENNKRVWKMQGNVEVDPGEGDSPGWISIGAYGGQLRSYDAVPANTTITPSTSNQTIGGVKHMMEGAVTVSGDANLVAGNIKSGTSIFGVTGTYSGGSSDVVMGTLTVASNVNTSTNTTIVTTSTIGFTPTKFFFWKGERTATSNHLHQASFVTIGSSYYIRTTTRYSNSALSSSGNANNWTTQTAGYLYFNSNTIYIRSSSSYILSAGTWHWVAVK